MKVKSDHRSKLITLHFHLQPQYKIWISLCFTSFHCTERYELNKLTSLPMTPMCGFFRPRPVGRASHRYRGGHGFESRWSPDIFQASSFQLLKIGNLLRWSLFTFIITFQQTQLLQEWNKCCPNELTTIKRAFSRVHKSPKLLTNKKFLHYWNWRLLNPLG